MAGRRLSEEGEVGCQCEAAHSDEEMCPPQGGGGGTHQEQEQDPMQRQIAVIVSKVREELSDFQIELWESIRKEMDDLKWQFQQETRAATAAMITAAAECQTASPSRAKSHLRSRQEQQEPRSRSRQGEQQGCGKHLPEPGGDRSNVSFLTEAKAYADKLSVLCTGRLAKLERCIVEQAAKGQALKEQLEAGQASAAAEAPGPATGDRHGAAAAEELASGSLLRDRVQCLETDVQGLKLQMWHLDAAKGFVRGRVDAPGSQNGAASISAEASAGAAEGAAGARSTTAAQLSPSHGRRSCSNAVDSVQQRPQWVEEGSAEVSACEEASFHAMQLQPKEEDLASTVAGGSSTSVPSSHPVGSAVIAGALSPWMQARLVGLPSLQAPLQEPTAWQPQQLQQPALAAAEVADGGCSSVVAQTTLSLTSVRQARQPHFSDPCSCSRHSSPPPYMVRHRPPDSPQVPSAGENLRSGMRSVVVPGVNSVGSGGSVALSSAFRSCSVQPTRSPSCQPQRQAGGPVVLAQSRQQSPTPQPPQKHCANGLLPFRQISAPQQQQAKIGGGSLPGHALQRPTYPGSQSIPCPHTPIVQLVREV